MRFIKRFLKWFVLVFIMLIISLYAFGYDYLLKAVRTIYFNGHTTAFLNDYTVFDNRIIENSDSTISWPVHLQYNKTQPSETLQQLHSDYKSVAFLIIKNDSLLHEQYFDEYTKDTKSNSFSIAKTMVSAMLNKAIIEGKIGSLDQPVGDFIPEFSKENASKMTVGDLSSMASGLNWDEAYYNPFSITTQAYFDDNLTDVVLNLKVTEDPGKQYKYLSGNTQLLAMVIEKATGEKLSNYLSSRFWKPLGMENEAFWQLDSKESGTEKAYCCIASNARDFAKFGKLYKDYGQWQGKQLLDSTFIAKSIKPRFENDWMYGYGLWLLPYQNKDFFIMRGHLGQYVIVEPEDNIIIVRLGHLKSQKKIDGGPYSSDLYGYIDEAYKMIQHVE